jgi:polyhydroxyalkanoate synthesis regulator phasin
MIDTIKKTLLAGVGAAIVTKEKIEASLGDLVKQGKVSAAEARTMAEKIATDGRAEYETLSQQLGERFRELLARDTERLQSRLTNLEARVAALEEKAPARTRKS